MADPLDPRPFRKRVGQMMSSPVRTVGADMPAAEAARQMAMLGLSSLVVTDRSCRPVGIITSGDLVNKVLALGRPPSTPVSEIQSAPLITCTPDDLYATALLLMVRHRIKHLPVVGPEGRLIGMVTMGDLSRGRDGGALAVADALERAPDLAHLRHALEQADAVVAALYAEKADPHTLLAVTTEFYDRVHRRCLELAQMHLGPAPVAFAFLVMGSGGRGEQYARTDQDNALVWADPPRATAAVDQYFARLGERLVVYLEQCGFARCPGNVMASNPFWRRPLSDWQELLQRWALAPTPERIRAATIFYDFRPVAGDPQVAAELRHRALDAAVGQRFLHHLAADDLRHRVPLGPFGVLLLPRWGEHAWELDLKTDLSVHIVDGVRALALQAGIGATGTKQRLFELVNKKELDDSLGESIDTAFSFLLELRIRRARSQNGLHGHNRVRVDALGLTDRRRLHEAMQAVDRLQDYLGLRFHVSS